MNKDFLHEEHEESRRKHLESLRDRRAANKTVLAAVPGGEDAALSGVLLDALSVLRGYLFSGEEIR
jgi:hypothetical protein